MKRTMVDFKSRTEDKSRVAFVIGGETFFCKPICASIVAGHKNGIAWVSEDTSAMIYAQWLKEDIHGKQLKEAFDAFKTAWAEFNVDVQETHKALSALYTNEDLAMA